MDHKESGTNSSGSTVVSDGTKFVLNNQTVPSSRNKSYDVGSNSSGKAEATAARPCAIIGPDRQLPSNPDDTMYLKKMPGETWPPLENAYRRPPDYPNKIPDYQPTRNISPRQTFQENMQRIMVPPTFSSMKSSEVTNLKNPKLNMPQEAKYCDVPYNLNSVEGEHKSVRSADIPMSNVNPYPRSMPPPYGWPMGVNVRPLRHYAAPEFYQYPEYPSCSGPRQMTMIRPHRPLHEESAQVYPERLYQDANIRFKPYPTGKEKHPQTRYDYVSNYPRTFHPPATIPSHKYDLQKPMHGHPYPMYPPVPYSYLDRRIPETFVDGFHRPLSQQANFNAFHNQVVPPPYGPIPGNCIQNKTYSDVSSKPINSSKGQFENNNKVYLNLESRNKNYAIPENVYYSDLNHTQAMRGEILLPTHSTLNIPPIPQHTIYRKDSSPLKPYDYSPNYRIFDQPVNVNHPLHRLPVQYSPNAIAISPSDSNTSNDTTHTLGTSQEDCGYVSQSSTASRGSFDSGNIAMQHDLYRRHSYNSYDIARNTFHSSGPMQIPKNKSSSQNKKNLNVRQFLQMWNEGDEEASEANKEVAAQNHAKKIASQSEIINNQEQLYVLGLVNVPNEELGKYDHIQKISKLPENIKGYNSIEILNQYEELLETPHVSNYTRSREYNTLSKSQIDRDITTKMPRPVSPLDVEAKISQSVIHKEVGCNFEIKPCSPEMLNAEVAAPVQNILGERMIEKVVNPIVTKLPSLNNENNKSPNTVSDVVNTASCKMISDQYSNNSLNKAKTSNYSVQDLEHNAGLCLASLPQLDNDIELNFPEINQQFIKANQIESNRAGLQHLPKIDLDQSNCLSYETKMDFRQNLSPQLVLGSGADKELSKLSKYRKGKKAEIPSLHNNTKEEMIISSDSMVGQQRINSVIIMNPDTNKSQDNEAVKITNYNFHKDMDASYSLENQNNIETYALSSETAIDFSLSRTEDETAVNYLNELDMNVNHLPQIEEFEAGSNESNVSPDFGSTKVHNTTAVKTIPTTKLVEDSQNEYIKFKNDEYTNQNKNNNQEMDYSMSKVPVKSPKVCLPNEEYNVLVMRNEEAPKPKTDTVSKQLDIDIQQLDTVEKLTSTEKIDYIKSPELSIHNSNTICQDTNEENFCLNTQPEEIAKLDTGPTVQACKSEKEIDLSSSTNAITNNKDQHCKDKCILDLKNDISHQASVTESLSDERVTKQYNIILKDSSDQYNANLVFECDSNKNVSENFPAINNSLIKNEDSMQEINELLISGINKDTNSTHSEKADLTLPEADDTCLHTEHRESSERNENKYALDIKLGKASSAVVIQQTHEKNIENVYGIMSSSEENSSVKNEPYFPDKTSEIVQCKPQNVTISSDIQHQFDCLTDKRVTNNSDKPVSTELCSEKTECEVADRESTKLLHDSQVGYPCNELDRNIKCQEEESFLVDETKCITASALNLEEFEKPKQLPPDVEDTNETNMKVTETKFLFDKVETIYDNAIEQSCSLVDKTVFENIGDKIMKCTEETELDNNLKEIRETTTDVVKFDGLSEESGLPCNNKDELCLSITNETTPDNLVITSIEGTSDTGINHNLQTNYKNKESCLSAENLLYTADRPISTSELGHEIDVKDNIQRDIEIHMDITKSDDLSCENNISSNELFEKSSNDKKPDNTSFKCSSKIEMDDSIQEEYQTFINEIDTECSSNIDSANNVDEYCLSQNRQTDLNSPTEIEEDEQITDMKEDKYGSFAKLVNDVPDTIDLKSTIEIKDEINIPNVVNENSDPWQCQSSDNKVRHSYCQKELFSPRFQKLLMFTGGICKLSTNKNKQHDIRNINSIGQDVQNVVGYNEMCESTEKNCNSNNLNNKFCDAEIENDLLNVSSETMQSDHVLTSITVRNNSYSTEKNHSIHFDTTRPPRKITKRSLSESALEACSNNDNVDFVHPCKRKKSLIENRSFLEAHNMITEDICSIIQTNRRNSISTFYNEENVYIVIDNDLILTEENAESNKLCFSENTDEFLTSVGSPNCEINLNLESMSCKDDPNQDCEYFESSQHLDEKSLENTWIDDVACIETVFSEDVAENITIDVHESQKKINSIDIENVDEEETSVFYDSDHIDKLKSIYGRTICNDNTQLIETLYRTPQMNVNKTLYHIESQGSDDGVDTFAGVVSPQELEPEEHDNCTDILESEISKYEVIDDKENISESLSLHSPQYNQNAYPNFSHDNDFKFDDFPTEEQEDKFTMNLCESSNDYTTSNIQKENSNYSCSSSPEVSSTTSEEKSSGILLKITNCNGSRVSQINEFSTDSRNKLSYKLTEKREYRNYNTNFSTSRTLITKAAKKYIPPIKDTLYDLKVKLPLPQHRLHTLKQLKITKVEPKSDATASACTVKKSNHDVSKKQKPKFEDVLKSIDEIHFKRHKDNIKKGKISIPKVIIKKNENGAHYASSRTVNRKETYNPDLTGRKWQPWVFLEKNNFVDKMVLQNKVKAIYCHRKNSYVLLEKFHKYKSVYNANFVISQPKSETKGNLKYTIRLKHS